MNLGIRLKPYEGEALGGFLQRLADRNGHSLLSLLYLLLHPSKKTVKQADIARIDYFPKNILNIENIEQHLGVSLNEFKRHSFWSLISHFVDEGEISSTKIMRGMHRINYAYCPQCLYESQYRRLIWNLKVISFCPNHNTQLNEVCTHCRRAIKLAHLRECSLCPYCRRYLGAKVEGKRNHESSIYESFIWDSVTKLQDESLQFMHTRQVAQKLIYMMMSEDRPIEYQHLKNKIGEKACAESLLQQARGSSHRRVHLLQIFNLLFINQWSIDDFLLVEVPATFISRLTEHLQPKIKGRPLITKRKVVQPPRKYKHNVPKQIEDICSEIHLEGGRITKFEVEKRLGISDNTLRKWGMLNIIEDYKKTFKEREHEDMKADWENRIGLFLQEETGDIYTNEIYEYIGVKSAVIRKVAPELIAGIQELRSDIRATQRKFNN